MCGGTCGPVAEPLGVVSEAAGGRGCSVQRLNNVSLTSTVQDHIKNNHIKTLWSKATVIPQLLFLFLNEEHFETSIAEVGLLCVDTWNVKLVALVMIGQGGYNEHEECAQKSLIY